MVKLCGVSDETMTVLLILSGNWNENDLEGIQDRCCPKNPRKAISYHLIGPTPSYVPPVAPASGLEGGY
jgi:hypothetical protein